MPVEQPFLRPPVSEWMIISTILSLVWLSFFSQDRSRGIFFPLKTEFKKLNAVHWL